MTPERLKQVEEIYHEAIDISPSKRKQFLADSCGDDADLRREIESLLSFEKSYDSLIDSSPESLINEVFSDRPNPKLIGRQVNQYKILSLLGEGGMGAVYLALDTTLERKVAIKFLSEKLISDGVGPSRFFLEAKSASALNHPNIITVHEISEFQNTPFIATEFIDGKTLKQYLADEKLILSEILDIAIQIASALSVAHKAGIIHRDIKPDNVMIRRDGILKILDFGLVKLNQNPLEIDTEANTRQQVSTMHGAVMGTPKYMSPEQARGKKVDTRTDIWSFGVVLYQMLTQHLPFHGETTSDTIAAILKSEPSPLSDFVKDISPELEEITLKTLKKDQKERYQTIDQLLEDLKRFRRELEFGTKTEPHEFRTNDPIYDRKQTDTGIARITAQNTARSSSGSISAFVSQTVESAKTHPSGLLMIIAVVGVLSVVGMLGWSRIAPSVSQSDAFQKMQLTRLTFDGTVTNEVSVSPDGKYFVYVLKEEDKQTLMLRQVATSSVVQLVPAAKAQYAGFTFTPNGNHIYYSVYQNDLSSLFAIPVLGGNPRKIANDIEGKVTFSTDGNKIAFVRAHNSLVIADSDGSSQRALATAPEGQFWTSAEWRPDGKTILIVYESTEDSRLYLAEISVSDGTIKPFAQSNWLGVNGLAWMKDGSGIVVAGRDPDSKFSQLWYLSYPDSKPQRISNDFSTYVGLSLTPDNKSLVTVKQDRLFNIWVYAEGKQDSLKKITVEEGRDEGIAGISSAPDGEVIYTVRTKEAFDLWRVNGDGTENRQLTFEEGSNFAPVVSPDGKYVVFTSTRSGNPDLWRMNIDGGDPVELTATPDSDDYASFTPDGKWIIFMRTNTKNQTTTWKLNLETQELVQLTEEASFKPNVSPDGKVFVCYYGESKPGESPKLAIIPIEGGKPIKILDLPLVEKSRFQWSSDGKSLVYIDRRDRIDNLWSQTLDSNPPKQLTFFDSGEILRFTLSPDGKGIAFSRGSDSSDVVLFDNFR